MKIKWVNLIVAIAFFLLALFSRPAPEVARAAWLLVGFAFLASSFYRGASQ